MKRILFGLVAAAGMLFATSCSKDADMGVVSNDVATVTFNVGLDHVIASRAYSDGTTVDKLYYAAYDSSNQVVGEVKTADVSGQAATATLTLVKGESYKVVFWAEKDGAYDVTSFPTVKYLAAGPKNNDETLDAFYAVESITAGEETSTVTLKRPFAQINFAGELPASLKDKVKKSKATVTGAFTGMNLLTGALEGGTEPVVFESNTLPTGDLTVDGKGYPYLSMAYIFTDGGLVSLEFELQNESGDKEAEYEVKNQDAKTLYRTNILGEITEDDFDFNVVIDPAFGEDNGEEDPQPEEKITVSEIVVDYSDGNVELMATIKVPAGQSVTSATFVCTPDAAGAALTRAEEGVVRIPAEVADDQDGKIISAEGTLEKLGLTAGVKYIVTVELDGKSYDAPAGDSEEDNVLDIPAATEPEPDPEVEAGTTPEKPFTVAEAIAKAEETGETATTEFYYVKGIVSAVTEHNVPNGNVTFDIVDKGASDVFTVYRVKWLNGENWSEDKGYVNVGDEVIVYGQIVNYKGNTPEFTQGTGKIHEFVSYGPTIDTFEVDYNAEAKTATFTATYTNKSGIALNAGFKYTLDSNEQDLAVENVSGGTFTKTISTESLAYGRYTVIAYVNDIVSTTKSFTIVDPTQEQPKQYTDVLTYDWIGLTSGSGYTAWSDKNGSESEAVYTGMSNYFNSTASNRCIQLRTTNKNEGVISTTTGGKVTKISVKWNTANSNGATRVLKVYGKDTAYTAVSDLFGDNAGTEIASFAFSAGDNEVEIVGNYSYIGFRSNDGALYLEEVKITWEK